MGTFGDIGCFSFFSNKNISTGEGGMFVTNNREYFDKAKLLRSHGMTSLSYERSKGHANTYDVVDFGFNYRMDDIRASIGIIQLDKIHHDLQKRAEVRRIYLDKFKYLDNIIIPFADHNEFILITFSDCSENVNNLDRDEVRNKLASNGVQTSMHYPAVHRFSVYSEFYKELPKTDLMVNSMITLPMYGGLSEADIEYIANQFI